MQFFFTKMFTVIFFKYFNVTFSFNHPLSTHIVSITHSPIPTKLLSFLIYFLFGYVFVSIQFMNFFLLFFFLANCHNNNGSSEGNMIWMSNVKWNACEAHEWNFQIVAFIIFCPFLFSFLSVVSLGNSNIWQLFAHLLTCKQL